MVRIVQISLHDFKNIAFGEIAFSKSKPDMSFIPGADVIGIYGQNGSGKTSVIEAIDLVKSRGFLTIFIPVEIAFPLTSISGSMPKTAYIWLITRSLFLADLPMSGFHKRK